MTTHYTVITAWIDSCDTDEQLDTVGLFVSDKLITYEKQRDDITNYLHYAIRRRSWTGKQIMQDRCPVSDEHFSDIIN